MGGPVIDGVGQLEVVKLRSGEFDLRKGGTILVRVPSAEAEAVALNVLELLGWVSHTFQALAVEDREPIVLSPRDLALQLERMRRSGKSIPYQVVHRRGIAEGWQKGEAPEEPAEEPGPRQRQYVKTPTAPRQGRQASRPRERQESVTPAAEEIVFNDPERQLRHEVWNEYLHSVPESQRGEWPHSDGYTILPAFMADIADPGSLSRQQVVSAVVDVITGRVWSINARKPRPFRDGGGDDGRPPIERSDGAAAWRANVQTGTPAARRIMWWRNVDARVELARLASHDDMEMPER